MALLKAILLAVVVGYVAIAALVWLVQERLIFMPVGVAAPPQAPAGWRLEKVSVAARDGTRLAGVLLLPPAPRAPLVIYYGGNAEEATASAPQARATYGDRALLLMNYRGYGESGGKPGEKALIADALEMFDWAAARADIDAARIAVHGRSLGTAIAVPVAAARPAKCVVLTSPFASALEVAAEIYPWLPVAWMLRHPFDSGRLAPRISSPALILAGEADTIIPKRHSERLAAAWGGPVERVSFAGFGHNDLDLNPRYAQAIRAFLDRCL
jgi:fermentation-respiration switch protein FrsA (DUF1100 family)